MCQGLLERGVRIPKMTVPMFSVVGREHLGSSWPEWWLRPLAFCISSFPLGSHSDCVSIQIWRQARSLQSLETFFALQVMTLAELGWVLFSSNHRPWELLSRWAWESPLSPVLLPSYPKTHSGTNREGGNLIFSCSHLMCIGDVRHITKHLCTWFLLWSHSVSSWACHFVVECSPSFHPQYCQKKRNVI